MKSIKIPIKVKSSSIHNKGVFATNEIKKGQKIIEYVGRKISPKEGDRLCDIGKGRYVYTINKKQDLDGDVDNNPAKYINHSCSPNCEANDEKGRIWIYAIKKIKKEEELTYNYGYDIEDYEDYPCKCGSRNCVGFMISEEHWHKIKKKLK